MKHRREDTVSEKLRCWLEDFKRSRYALHWILDERK